MTAEPDVTPRQMIERAAGLRALLRDQQELTEARTCPTEEIHQACLDAGIYRLYVPRRYGGHELDPVTFMRVCMELARGDMSAAWCVGLAAAHALQVASWWPADAQDEIFGAGDFRCASVAAPVGSARRAGDAWELTGRVAYCSGLPLSTHYMGQALISDEDADVTGRMLLFVAPRDQFEVIDDWGQLFGLKGSGSNTIAFDHARIPAHWAIADALMVDYDVGDGTPGMALHGNPMYGGRAMGLFTLSLAAFAVGAARQALDEYEAMLDTKMSVMPPFVPRRHDAGYQQWFGLAMARIATADAAVINATEQHVEACLDAVHEGIPYTYLRDWQLSCIAREAIDQIWNTVEQEIFRTAGSSAATGDSRLVRVYRDLSMLRSHRNMLMRDWAHGEVAREYLGLPRSGPGNVQSPHPGRAAADRL
ncbi:MAG TPA: acyl-CoA dehydrogenase family protein [Solirubrobacteraceae bacterium]|jgi:3-hydroxy-9,10-secoandrosta-1,3,5(10)-triene-9,17-dione monooxygenase|nr:acyl-CoA dehydrogenase family protein [Solirubrobacteraceae bacterium]